MVVRHSAFWSYVGTVCPAASSAAREAGDKSAHQRGQIVVEIAWAASAQAFATFVACGFGMSVSKNFPRRTATHHVGSAAVEGHGLPDSD